MKYGIAGGETLAQGVIMDFLISFRCCHVFQREEKESVSSAF